MGQCPPAAKTKALPSLGHGPGGRDIHTRAGLPDKAVVALPGTLGCVKGGMSVGHVVGVGREAVAAGLAR